MTLHWPSSVTSAGESLVTQEGGSSISLAGTSLGWSAVWVSSEEPVGTSSSVTSRGTSSEASSSLALKEESSVHSRAETSRSCEELPLGRL